MRVGVEVPVVDRHIRGFELDIMNRCIDEAIDGLVQHYLVLHTVWVEISRAGWSLWTK